MEEKMKKTIVFLMMLMFAIGVTTYANDTTTVAQDSTQVSATKIDLPVKPEEGGLGNMIGYVIAVVVVVVARILPMFKKVQDLLGGISSPLIQRWLSETSRFMIKLNSISIAATVLVTSLLSSGIITGYWFDILTTINIALIAIAGLTVITTNDPKLQN